MFCFACYLHFDLMFSKGHGVKPATPIVVTTCQFVVNARAAMQQRRFSTVCAVAFPNSGGAR